MKTLVIYDNTGKILYSIAGNYYLPHGGIQYLEVEIPSGKALDYIDVSAQNHIAIFKYTLIDYQAELIKRQAQDELMQELIERGVI